MNGRSDATASSGLRTTTTYLTSGFSPGDRYGRSPGPEWVLKARRRSSPIASNAATRSSTSEFGRGTNQPGNLGVHVRELGIAIGTGWCTMFMVQVVPLLGGTEMTMSPSRHSIRCWMLGSIHGSA